jgi:uncharacterized protein YjbJ (UPF0337 family)
MGKSAPAPSNYTNTANAQSAASQNNINAQTAANRPNVAGRSSSQQWTQGPDGQWSLAEGYGANQGLADQLKGQATDAFGKPLDDGSAARQQTIDSAYGQAQKRLDPQWAQRQQISDSTIANQGIDPNSAAAQAARREFSNNRNDAYSSAMAGAVREGNAAGGEVYRNNLNARNNPLQQLLALAGMGGPQFNTAGQAETPQLLAAGMAQDAAAQRAYEAQQRQITDAIAAGGQLLGGIGKMFAF